METSRSFKSVRGEPWFLSMLCLALIPVFPEYYGAPFLCVAALFFALKDTGRPFLRHHIPLTGQFILLYIAYMAIGLFYSFDLGSTMLTIGFWITAYMAYMAFMLVVTSRERLEWMLFLLALAAGLVGFIAIVQRLLGVYTNLPVNMQFFSFLDGFLKEISGLPFNLKNHGNRASSTFANPNVLAEYLVMALPFLLYASLKTKDLVWRRWIRISLILAVFGLFFSYSRGGYIAAIVVFLVYLIYYRKFYQTLLFICVASLIIVPSSVVRRLFSISQASGVVSEMLSDDFTFEDGISDDLDESILEDGSQDTYVERMDVLLVGLQIFTEKPLWGVGAGMFTTWEVYLDRNINVPHAHNLIIQLLLEGGVLSLLLMLAAGGTLLVKGCNLLRKQKKDTLLGVAVIAFFCGFVASGLFDFPLLSPKLVSFFMVVLALCDTAYSLYVPHRHYSMFSHLKQWLICKTEHFVK